MIYAVSCDCPSSELKVRSKLKEADAANWASVPIIIGRDKSLTHLNNLFNKTGNKVFKQIYKIVAKNGKYRFVIGAGNGESDYVDLVQGGAYAKNKLVHLVDKFGSI